MGRKGRAAAFRGGRSAQDDYPDLFRVMEGGLNVSGYDAPGRDGDVIRRWLADLDSFPKELLARLRRRGLRILVGIGCVVDFEGFWDLLYENVPGRGPRARWKDVGAMYSGRLHTIVLGTVAPEPHTVPHELAHALGHMFGHYERHEVDRAFRRYLAQVRPGSEPDPRSCDYGFWRKEFFANSVAHVILMKQGGKSILTRDLTEEYVLFIEGVVLQGYV